MKNYKYKISLFVLIAIIGASFAWGVLLFSIGRIAVNGISDFSSKIKSYYSELPDKIKDLKNEKTKSEKDENCPAVKVVDEQSQVIEVVKKASPAVVSIVASAEVPVFENYFDNPFGDFFGFGVPRQRQNGTKEVKVSAGTGFIVSSDGYIVTNKHVVSNKDAKYVVYLNGKDSKGEKIEAKVLARDPNTDLAILKINRKNLTYLEFGDSDSLQVGQTAITIGYALGEFDNTVSKGVVSGLSRSITAGDSFGGMQPERLTGLIQTDAAVNPGNSGGPMLNLEGKVIGVNVAMANAENIGFALPGNKAKKAFEEVRNSGTIKKEKVAFLGIRYMLINDALQKKNNLPYDYGALVSRGDSRGDIAVIPGSPADKAGIVENDIILEVNGEKVTERTTLADIVSKYKPGDEVTLKIFHKGQEKDLKVKLGKK